MLISNLNLATSLRTVFATNNDKEKIGFGWLLAALNFPSKRSRQATSNSRGDPVDPSLVCAVLKLEIGHTTKVSIWTLAVGHGDPTTFPLRFIIIPTLGLAQLLESMLGGSLPSRKTDTSPTGL